MKWLIWSKEHNAWWGANRCGYVADVWESGRYDELEARDICNDANHWPPCDAPPNETMCPAPEEQ